MIVKDLAVGLQLGAGILWGWLLWRIVFESWVITEAPDAIRRRGWIHFRRFLFLMGFATVFFYTPEMFMRSRGASFDISLYLMLPASVTFLSCGIMIHHGLDIVALKKPSTVVIYFVIALLCVMYAVAGSVL